MQTHVESSIDSLGAEAYLFEGEEIEAVHTEPKRSFVVTDTRVLDIRKEESVDGVPELNLSCTLFNNIAGVDFTDRESTSSDVGEREMYGFGGISVALLLILYALTLELVAGAVVVLIGGLVGYGGYWALNNLEKSETESPGKTEISLHYSHAKARKNVSDTYSLQSEEPEIFRAITRAVGKFQGAVD